jgi:hypothetical protein
VLVSSHRLQPSGTTLLVRGSSGKPVVTDGPFAETKEQLGGVYILDVPDLDAALHWAGRCPATGHGTVEVRPLWTPQRS